MLKRSYLIIYGYRPDGSNFIASHSKNLRGMLDFTRKHQIAHLVLSRTLDGGGYLLARWEDEKTFYLSLAPFVSYSVMESWVCRRRIFKGVTILRTLSCSTTQSIE